MIKNENIICISSIDWDFIWQGHQEIMSTLAKNGNRVLFIENTGVRSPGIRDFHRLKRRMKNYFKGIKGIRRERDNLYIFSPMVLPFPYFRIGRWINCRWILSALKKWMTVMDFNDPITWTFLPTPLSLDMVNHLTKRITIYYCIDNFRVSSPSARKIVRSETSLLKKADIVFVTSKELYDYCSRYSDNVHFFPFAVSYDKFEKVRLRNESMPKELVEIKKPIVGYVGGLHKWVDQQLIKEIAQRNKDLSFVFIGPKQTDISLLEHLDNVYFLGEKRHHELPLFINNFDVCIIPYKVTDYTRNVYPTKLNEYFAMAKPVVSIDLPEILSFNKTFSDMVYVAKNSSEFDNRIKQALQEDNQDLKGKRIAIAKENSWSNSIERMDHLIVENIEKKKQFMERDWKNKLIGFYKKAQKRIVIFSAALILVYIVIFKTAFVWFLAEPLKISHDLTKADVIVVFGGGVGETGSPGKSTIERARYATHLYKQGYGNKIIFSSGYTYKYNDAENMKLFALSMEVPESSIILEQEAGNTYQNVKFTKEILDRRNWGTILLVSSPYNMKRASLVFRKLASGIKVIYAPIPNPQFYSRKAGSRWQQIRAIFHEYLGIVYYYFKGYV